MQYPIDIPPLVTEALALAESLGFDTRPEGNRAGIGGTTPSCCIKEAGALLRTLVSTIVTGKIGEIGTGAGVGAAWITAGLSDTALFVTVELKEHLFAGASQLLEDHPNVDVLCGDWKAQFLQHGPFDLLFADGGGVGNGGPEHWQEIASLVRVGGMLVMDDVTPEEFWPDSWRGSPDPKRELAFNSGYFCSTEVRVRADISVLLMVRQAHPADA